MLLYYIYKIKSGEEWKGQTSINQFKNYELIKVTDNKEEAHSWNKKDDIFVDLEMISNE